MRPRVVLAEFAPVDGSTRVEWSDGVVDVVTTTWLRDACHCVDCRGPNGGQRRFDIADLPTAAVVAVELVDGDLVVVFADGHEGGVPGAVIGRRRPAARRPRWGSDHGAALRRRSAPHDGDLSTFLADLDRYGVALAHGVPAERGQVVAFAERIGFVRETNYGRLFDVVVEPDPANLANSSVGLAVHTDNPYREPAPTVQLLHCIRSTSAGGATRLVDGFAAAERLAAADRAAFDLLCSREVPFRYHDHGVDLRARGRLIELDGRGDVVSVRINNRSMEPLDLPAADLERFYAAYRAFAAELGRPEATIEHRLRPGELLAFDNRRTLHGRAAYPARSRRLLQGCYIDIDAIRSAVLVGEAGEPSTSPPDEAVIARC